jgi:hypothetical protein
MIVPDEVTGPLRARAAMGGHMPQTEPIAPPTKLRKRDEPPPEPRPDLDPFNADWPQTRPTPEPKARDPQ